MKRRDAKRGESGAALLMVLVLMAIGSMLSASFYSMLHIGLAGAYQRGRVQTAMNLADAGLETAVAALRLDRRYAGQEDTPLGDGTFSVTVAPREKPGSWRIVSTGIFKRNADSFHAKARVVADLQLDAGSHIRALNWREGGPCK